MQKHRLFILLLISVTVIGFSACYQDYPDGRDISIYSQKDRIAGTWVWSKNEANNLNVTGKYVGWTIDFSANGKVTICDSGNVNCHIGTWNLVTQKTGLQVVMSDSIVNLPDYQAIEFTINRLTKDEIYLDYAGNKADATEGIVKVNPIYWELTRKQ